MGWVVNATPRPLYPRERPGTHCIGDWVSPRTGLDGCGIYRPHTGIRSPDRPSRSKSLYWVWYPRGRGGEVFRKSYVKREFRENRLRYSHTLLKRHHWMSARTFHSQCPICVKSQLKIAAHVWVTLFGMCEFHENWRREGSAFLMHVNDDYI